MRIHAIQTGAVAIKERQRQGYGSGPLRQVVTLADRNWTAPLPIYAWVVEHPEGLLVIDSGESALALEPGYFTRWNPYFSLGLREAVRPEEEIGPRMAALGLSVRDVRWLVLTHMHTDHVGGLSYFPHAEVLLSRTEYDSSVGLRGQLRGALPQHWPSWFAPRLVQFSDSAVGPFEQSHTLTRAGDVSLVATPGHTAGHQSVVVHDGNSVLCFAGDTSYTEGLMTAGIVDGVSPNVGQARRTLDRIVRFARTSSLVYLPSHDPASADRLASRQTVRASQSSETPEGGQRDAATEPA